MAKLRLALVQMRMGADPAANLQHALDLTAGALRDGARLVCLPELFRSRYFCQTEDAGQFGLAEAIPGPSTEAFARLAAAHGATIVLSLFERRAPGLYHNTAAVLDGARGLVGTYRKMHIPDDPRYYEKYYFTPGDLGFRVHDTAAGRLGVLVCWDQWYPEAARLTALQGAGILIYPTAIGWHPEEKAAVGERQHAAWETIQRAHAIANGCFVVAINRSGFEPEPGGTGGIEFWGQSFVAGPDGRVIGRAAADREEVLMAEIDLDEIERQRQGWPFLRDRRIDAYDGITRRFIDEAG
ncbi:MAG: carbon-nitrogen hydrolase [Gammaproteobacteria bacterium]|nr:MAG: carbon-nitrogen hydrolase [Gammaproteobacteria bacterium]